MRPTSAWRSIPSPARRRRIWFLALLIIFWADSAGAVRITDDTGQDVSLDRPAARVIALYGGLGEILHALGRGDALVARTGADLWPPSVAKLPVIGTHMRPNIESVLAHRPDLVLQLAGRRESSLPVEALRRRGVRVAVFHASNFAELFSVMRRVGVLVGAEAEAGELVQATEARLAAVEARLSGVATRPRVFYEVRSPSMLAAGRSGMVAEVIRRAGGINCIEEKGRFARLGEEEIVRLNPDVYLIQRGPMNQAPLPLSQRPRLKGLAAAKNGRSWFVDERRYSRPGPQSIEAVEELAGLLYPERFPAPHKKTAKDKK